jgi:hypothetical protein
VFTLNQQVQPSFACSALGAAITSCSASPLVGGNLDTTTVGDHVLVITATDVGGATYTRRVPYSVHYTFDGFRQPVDNPPTLNVAKAGSTIPVKWALKDATGKVVSDLSAVTAISVTTIPCPTAPTDTIETTVAAGLSGLTYDSAGQQFVYNWQTTKGWTGCRRLSVQLNDATDGSTTRSANFQFK